MEREAVVRYPLFFRVKKFMYRLKFPTFVKKPYLCRAEGQLDRLFRRK